jgi:hypothetical protein
MCRSFDSLVSGSGDRTAYQCGKMLRIQPMSRMDQPLGADLRGAVWASQRQEKVCCAKREGAQFVLAKRQDRTTRGHGHEGSDLFVRSYESRIRGVRP